MPLGGAVMAGAHTVGRGKVRFAIIVGYGDQPSALPAPTLRNPWRSVPDLALYVCGVTVITVVAPSAGNHARPETVWVSLWVSTL